MRRTQKNESGLTLMEFLVVALLLGILSTVLYGSLRGIIQGKELVEGKGSAEKTARFIFRRLTKEISGRALIKLRERKDGERKVSNNIRYFVGRNGTKNNFSADSLHFVSTSAAQAVFGAEGNFGAVEIEYRLEDNPNEKLFGQNQDPPSRVLIREEIPAQVEEKTVLRKRRIVSPIADNIVALNFRFLRNGEWVDKWTGSSGQIPEAVEVALGIRAENTSKKSDNIQYFKTAIAVQRKTR